MNTTNVTTPAYRVITINRSKEVVRYSDAAKFKDALDIVANNINAANNANWKTFVNGTYAYPNYIVRNNSNLAGTFATSFSMINGRKDEGGEYYFTYIKKVA